MLPMAARDAHACPRAMAVVHGLCRYHAIALFSRLLSGRMVRAAVEAAIAARGVGTPRPPRPPPPPQRLSWRPLPLAVSAFPARAPSSTATAAFVEAPAGGGVDAPRPPAPSFTAAAPLLAALGAGVVDAPRLPRAPPRPLFHFWRTCALAASALSACRTLPRRQSGCRGGPVRSRFLRSPPTHPPQLPQRLSWRPRPLATTALLNSLRPPPPPQRLSWRPWPPAVSAVPASCRL